MTKLKRKKKKTEASQPKVRNTILKRKQERKLKKIKKKEVKKKFFEAKVTKKSDVDEKEMKIQEEALKKKEKMKRRRENKKRKQEEEHKEQRKNQLMQENEDDEKVIKRLEKQLGMKKRKSKNLPKSFLDDGLDYLLGSTGDMNCEGLGSDIEDMMGQGEDVDSDGQMDDDDGLDDGSDQQDEEYNREGSDEDELDPNEEDFEEGDDDLEMGPDDQSDDENAPNGGEENSEDESEMDESGDDLDENDETAGDGTWEDIYGRTRAKDGTILEGSKSTETSTGSTGKYIPPALRKSAGSEKKDLTRLKKQLKGGLNRLAESNMHSIATQIENMYRQNSRNDMNETIFSLIKEAVVAPVLTPERLVMEYAMLIAILHANIGLEVGAYFIEELNNLFFNTYRETNLDEESGKELDNIILIISYIFNFRIVDSKYIFDLMGKLTESFKPKDIELILICLKSTGFVIRKADPTSMKNLIVRVQNKASTCSTSDSRVQFMVEVLLAVKNNNVNKIPNYDPSHLDHLKKIIKTFIREGNFVSEIKVGLKDLENAETLGRWWIVGSYYAGNLVGGDQNTGGGKGEGGESGSGGNEEEFSAQLLQLARKMRMNTDSRRKIFCIVMSSEDYLDATEKLLKLGTRNQTERDVMFVLLDCSLQEKAYNPFYAHLAVKLSAIDRKYRLANQFCIWDKIKLTSDMKERQLDNLGKFVTHMIRERSQGVAVLRTVHFAEMNKPNVRLLRLVLCDVLLNENEESIRNIFEAVGKNPNLNMFREGLRLFLKHFILKKKKNLDPKIDFKKLEERVKLAEFCLNTTSLKL